ncbi:MAG TPA: YciI family protein [Planctomycetaceae bacterium]|nr:YciI family protein [Planctomycetaceae bacterium]
MPKFMLILTGAPDALKNLSPEELQLRAERYQAWVEGIRSSGRYVSGEKLGNEGGRLLSKKQGKVSVVDGPFAEAKEVVGGYMLLRADSYDHALELIRNAPMLEDYRIELRQTDPMGCGGE